MTLCQSMQCSIPKRKAYDQIWPVLPSSRDMFFEVSALQVSNVIAFCSVLLPSTVFLLSGQLSAEPAQKKAALPVPN